MTRRAVGCLIVASLALGSVAIYVWVRESRKAAIIEDLNRCYEGFLAGKVDSCAYIPLAGQLKQTGNRSVSAFRVENVSIDLGLQVWTAKVRLSSQSTEATHVIVGVGNSVRLLDK